LKQSLQPLTNCDGINSVVNTQKVDDHSKQNQNPKILLCSHERNIQLTSYLVAGALKTNVSAVEALRRNERQDETQFTTKIGGKTSLGPNYLAL